jgi:hypothetical protein
VTHGRLDARTIPNRCGFSDSRSVIPAALAVPPVAGTRVCVGPGQRQSLTLHAWRPMPPASSPVNPIWSEMRLFPAI